MPLILIYHCSQNEFVGLQHNVVINNIIEINSYCDPFLRVAQTRESMLSHTILGEYIFMEIWRMHEMNNNLTLHAIIIF